MSKKAEKELLLNDAKMNKRIKKSLTSLETLVKSLANDAQAYRKQIYIDNLDLKDVRYRPDTSINQPIVANINKLSTSSFILYKFGVNLMNKLRINQSLKSINLLLATALPTPIHTQIAYCNSYYYSIEEETLFIRDIRLDDAGSFILVLIHAIAHINTSANTGEWDDRNKSFVAMFLKLLQIICGDMIYNKVNIDKSNKQQILSSTRDIIVDELLTDNEYNIEKMLNRMRKYSYFAQYTKLQQHLSDLEYKVLEKDNESISIKDTKDDQLLVIDDITDRLNNELFEVIKSIYTVTKTITIKESKKQDTSTLEYNLTELNSRKEKIMKKLDELEKKNKNRTKNKYLFHIYFLLLGCII